MTENETNSTSTPNIRKNKSLGIRHTGKKKGNFFKTPLSESQLKVFATKTDSPKTPLNDSEFHPRTEESKSTGCLPLYKLSMSKRFRAHYKKKKLEFATVDDTDSCVTEFISPAKPKDVQIEISSSKSSNSKNLTDNISQQEHQYKITELENTIQIWKTAFKNSLDDLSNKLNEDKEIILQKLQISPNIIKLA